MKPKKLLTTIAIVSVVLIAGCKQDNFEGVVGLCPVVVSTSPANATTGVPLDKIVTVTFNEKIDPATISQTSFSLQGATSIAGTFSYTDTTISFIPSSPLEVNTTYTGRVKSTVKDKSGNALQTDYVWTFTTGGTLSPTVISTDPANAATGVVLNKIITATFSVPMDPLTLTATTFTLKQGATSLTGIITYAANTAYFTPSANLVAGTVYTATITTGAKNTMGTILANNYVWTFTTGASVAPTVVSTDPANNATNVALNKIVTATFSVPMDSLTLTASTFTLKLGATVVAGTVTYTGTTASFTPSVYLLSGNSYTATITTGAKNLAGISLVNDYVWNFNTVPPLGPPVIDLKSVARFGIYAGVGVSNNLGQSEIHDMDLGVYPGIRAAITGFPPGIVINGAIYASDDTIPVGVSAMLAQAKQDLTDAYTTAESATLPVPTIVTGDQGGKTLTPGIYKSTSTLSIQSGNLILDAQGDVNAVWIFQIASGFTTIAGAGGNVILTGGAQANNVFWQVGSSATIGDGTAFIGNVLALTTITMNSDATAIGRMLVRNGTIFISTNIIHKP